MHLGLKTGPLCPIFYIKLKEPCSFNKVPDGLPYLIPNYLQVQKKEPRYKCQITMCSCLLSEFHLTGALSRIPTGVPYLYLLYMDYSLKDNNYKHINTN